MFLPRRARIFLTSYARTLQGEMARAAKLGRPKAASKFATACAGDFEETTLSRCSLIDLLFTMQLLLCLPTSARLRADGSGHSRRAASVRNNVKLEEWAAEYNPANGGGDDVRFEAAYGVGYCSRRRRNGWSDRGEAESRFERLPGSRAHASCMGSHGPGVDGLRLRGGAFRTVSARAAGRPENFVGTILRALAMVRHRANRRRGDRESIRRMATRSLGPGSRSWRCNACSSCGAGGGDRIVPGVGRAGDDNLSDFGARFRACKF